MWLHQIGASLMRLNQFLPGFKQRHEIMFVWLTEPHVASPANRSPCGFQPVNWASECVHESVHWFVLVSYLQQQQQTFWQKQACDTDSIVETTSVRLQVFFTGGVSVSLTRPTRRAKRHDEEQQTPWSEIIRHWRLFGCCPLRTKPSLQTRLMWFHFVRCFTIIFHSCAKKMFGGKFSLFKLI